jgi:carbon starvation protein
MEPVVVLLMCFAIYAAGYKLYAGFLAKRIFELREDAVTPAHSQTDGVDYVPTNKFVLFGHHYASITGLSPMLGPAIAVIWGWFPALVWVVLGTVFVGAVHDFGALVLSVRAKGMSIGVVAEDVIGPRAKSLFHAIIFFLVALAMGVFIHVVATLYTPDFHPEAVFPSGALMVMAVFAGILIYKLKFRLGPLTAVAFVIMLGLVWLSTVVPMPVLGIESWKWILVCYCFIASVLPVWLLLQPRDYINSLLLYLGLVGSYLGLFLLRPSFAAPAIQTHPEGAPPLFPFVFIVIACGAISGFHGLVSSGTTAKQLDRETNARFIGYGGMVGESLLGLLSVLACTAGFATAHQWSQHYQSWHAAQGLGINIKAFIAGTGHFLESLGVPAEVGEAFVALVVVSFALTTLDSATRLLRFNISEIGDTLGAKALGNRTVASLLACAAIGFFAFYKVDGRPAGLILWELFGTTNQILGGLILLAITLYLMRKKKPMIYTLLPMLFMFASTVSAMVIKIVQFYRDGHYLLLALGILILVLALWLVGEAVVRVKKARGGGGQRHDD